MPAFPKQKNYRNQKLRDLAKECPQCMYCGETNVGQVVGCHSNSHKFGKGLGCKASDAPIAFLCMACHDWVDGRDGTNSNSTERELVFYEGACKTWLWLMQNGHLILALDSGRR